METIIIDFTYPQTTETVAEMRNAVIAQLANFIQSNAADIDEYTQMDAILHTELKEHLEVRRVERLTMDELDEDITIKEMKALFVQNKELIEFQKSSLNEINNYEIVEAAEHLAIRNYLKEQDKTLTDEAIDLIFSHVRNEMNPDDYYFAVSVSETYSFIKKFNSLTK